MKKVISFLFLFASFNAYSQENHIEPQRWYFSLSGGASVTTSQDLDYYSKDQHVPSYNAELLYSLSRYTALQFNYDNNTSSSLEQVYKNVSFSAGLRYHFHKKLFAEASAGLYDINFLNPYVGASSNSKDKVFYSGISFGAGTLAKISDNISLITKLRFHLLAEENYSFLTLNAGLMLKNGEQKNKAEGKSGYYISVFSGVLDALAGNHKLAGAFGLEAGKEIRNHIFLNAGYIYNNPSRAKYFFSINERKYTEAYMGAKIYFGAGGIRLFIEPGFGFYGATHSFDFAAETVKKSSFGLYAGAGGETAISEEVDIFARLRYNNLVDLGNDNFVSFHGGVKYNF